MSSLEIPSSNTPVISNEDVFNLHNLSSSQSNTQGTYDQLNELFNNQDAQEKTIREARDILGESVNELSNSQIFDLVNEVQFLVESWLEEFERNTFDGKTLDELIGLKT
ncbi:MAG: hypothetical protein M1277_00015 [Patescibacteria group bacterium]|nr:hypothetical protein [Patescibacteria group bacterium]